MVDADAVEQGRLPTQNAAGLRQEVVRRILGIQTHFHGVAGQADFLLLERQRLAGGDANLPGHQVLPGDQLGHRVLDLQAGVHFQEEEFAAAIQQKLHGAGADIVDRGGRLDRGLAHGLTQLRRHQRAGRFLDHLLVAALHRTVAFAQIDDMAVLVAEHLDFHMARLDHRPFEDQFAGAEGVLRFRTGGADLRQQFRPIMHQAHATTTAAGAGLDHQRVADALGLTAQGLVVLLDTFVAGDAGHAGLEHGDLRQTLAAHQLDGCNCRADKHDAGGFAGAGEIGVLREKAIAGVDGVGAGFLCGGDDGVDPQVGLVDLGRAYAHGLVGQLHMTRVGIGLGVHRHAAVAQGLGGAHHPAGDFAAVGDQDFVEGGHAVLLLVGSLAIRLCGRGRAAIRFSRDGLSLFRG
ncbi:hypothetical protein D3C85_896050 [compost metagenome]